MMFLRLPEDVEADWAEDTEYDAQHDPSEHQEVQHEFGPSWCSVCETPWPCKEAS